MPRLRRRLLALTGDPHDADDLLQETYLRLSRRARAQSLTRQQHPYAYTCAVALNLLRDSWQHPSRRERTTDRLPEAGWDGGLASYEASATALALLRMLSEKEAAAVILVDLEGLSHDTAGRTARRPPRHGPAQPHARPGQDARRARQLGRRPRLHGGGARRDRLPPLSPGRSRLSRSRRRREDVP